MNRLARGVTLIELIMVIVITGIIGTIVAIFIRQPVEGYLDAARRAELTDIADTALRRISRDLRTALPNSIRVDPTGRFIEYLQTSGGGRYRTEPTSTGTGNPLDFITADVTFDVIGPVPALAAGDSIVIYNLSADPAVTSGNAYVGDNRANYGSVAGQTITLNPAHLFPLSSPGYRFHVVQYPVTYHCDLGSGRLTRYWNYTIAATQPTPPGGGGVLLATNVTDCSFIYTTGGVMERTGVVALTLQISQSGENVRLFQQIHVNNAP